MELVKFRFNINFDLKDLDNFLKDLFNDKNVRQIFQPLNYVMSSSKETIEKFKYKKLSTQKTNLDLFNVMYESEIVSEETGYIKKDYDDYVEDISICDKLKQALIKEESDYYCIFNEEVRNELLFHIFQRICIGGALCQYEDTVNEYLEMTKYFYKGNFT